MKLKILVIEDELAYLDILCEQLAKNGYTVICEKDGMKGLATAKSQHPDLILLDLRIPAMDGLSVLKELRKDGYGNSVKVILLTNLEATDSIVEKVISYRPAFYLMKSDIQIAELLEKIRELFNTEEGQNPRASLL